ncbi:hypothetical protein BaRGS_00004308 [Batillaria attramentaria]|uniref:LRAT domain-containing protein n=1 Tax=Batillaria attramentaria TaxID=370345 RepID=A0ABD0LYD5_9CAEN
MTTTGWQARWEEVMSVSKHVFSINGEHFTKAYVKEDRFLDVAGNCLAIRDNGKDALLTPLPPEEIKANAVKMLGEANYNLLHYNCEHFATWCRYGRASSDQANVVLDGVTAVKKLDSTVADVATRAGSVDMESINKVVEQVAGVAKVAGAAASGFVETFAPELGKVVGQIAEFAKDKGVGHGVVIARPAEFAADAQNTRRSADLEIGSAKTVGTSGAAIPSTAGHTADIRNIGKTSDQVSEVAKMADKAGLGGVNVETVGKAADHVAGAANKAGFGGADAQMVGKTAEQVSGMAKLAKSALFGNFDINSAGKAAELVSGLAKMFDPSAAKPVGPEVGKSPPKGPIG